MYKLCVSYLRRDVWGTEFYAVSLIEPNNHPVMEWYMPATEKAMRLIVVRAHEWMDRNVRNRPYKGESMEEIQKERRERHLHVDSVLKLMYRYRYITFDELFEALAISSGYHHKKWTQIQ